jgi:carboxyl-terminal processing protease
MHPGFSRFAQIIALIGLMYAPAAALDLADKYPCAAPSEEGTQADAKPATFTEADIYEITKFVLDKYEPMTVKVGRSDLAIGHNADGAVWAVVIPREEGWLTSPRNPEPEVVDHIWLRFHPGVLGDLFPPETVIGAGRKNVAERVRDVAKVKLFNSWHVGERAVVPPLSEMIVDVDLTTGRRRFFRADRARQRVHYIRAFENRGVSYPAVLKPGQAAEAVELVWSTYDREYPMFGLCPEVDWAAVGKEYRAHAARCLNERELVQLLTEMLEPLRDDHIWIKCYQGQIGVYHRPSRANYNVRALDRLIGEDADYHLSGVVSNKLKSGVGYIRIPSWKDEQIVKDVEKALEDLRETKALVIDVRSNDGGDERLAQRMAGRFATEDRVYAYARYRNGPQHGDFTEPVPRSIHPAGSWQYRKPVVLLIGQQCMSSNEWFICMMKQCRQVTTMGETTRGSSGNPKWIDLPGGVKVSMPTWLGLLADKRILNKEGIEPDMQYTHSQEGFSEDRDDLLEAALAKALELAKAAGRKP